MEEGQTEMLGSSRNTAIFEGCAHVHISSTHTRRERERKKIIFQ